MIGNIEIRYSTDNGSTWLPTSGFNTFLVNRGHTFLRREEQQEEEELDNSEASICVIPKARLIATVELDANQFNKNANTNHQTNYVYMNKLRCAALIHVRYTDTTPDEFWTDFNDVGTAYNTQYMTVEDAPDIIPDAKGNIKEIKFTLKAKNATAI